MSFTFDKLGQQDSIGYMYSTMYMYLHFTIFAKNVSESTIELEIKNSSSEFTRTVAVYSVV